MIESVTVNKWKAEATAKARIEDAIKILEKNFSPVPAEVKAKIEATTALDVLQDWVVLAATAETLDSFRRDAKI